jgi:hypothetical protein
MRDRWKTLAVSAVAISIVTGILTLWTLQGVRAMAAEQRDFITYSQTRARESRERWDRLRVEDQQREEEFHAGILASVRSLTADLRKENEQMRRLRSVTPVEAMRDRARVAR